MPSRRQVCSALLLGLAGCTGADGRPTDEPEDRTPVVETDDEPSVESEYLPDRNEVRVRYTADEPLTHLDEYEVETVQLRILSESFFANGHGTPAIIEAGDDRNDSGVWSSHEGGGIAGRAVEPGDSVLVTSYSDPDGGVAELQSETSSI
jgi:hypothetical protein